MARPPVITKLMPAECRRLIAAGGIGRIAFGTVSGPVVLPVNFAVVAGTIVIRTGEGTMIDGTPTSRSRSRSTTSTRRSARAGACWCAARRTASRIPAELQIVRRDAAIWPWPGGDRDVYVRIIPDKISGRRIESR